MKSKRGTNRSVSHVTDSRCSHRQLSAIYERGGFVVIADMIIVVVIGSLDAYHRPRNVLDHCSG